LWTHQQVLKEIQLAEVNPINRHHNHEAYYTDQVVYYAESEQNAFHEEEAVALVLADQLIYDRYAFFLRIFAQYYHLGRISSEQAERQKEL
jgi:hypothetical protein